MKARRTHEPTPYSGGAIIYLATKTGAVFQRAGDALGWRAVIGGPIDVVHVEAWHDTLLAEPSVAVIASDLSRRLEALDAARLTI